MILNEKMKELIKKQYPELPEIRDKYRCERSGFVLEVHDIYLSVKISMRHRVSGHSDGYELVDIEKFFSRYKLVSQREVNLEDILSRATPEEVQRIRELLKEQS